MTPDVTMDPLPRVHELSPLDLFHRVVALHARVTALETALETAKTLWFNALFDHGTPRDVHITGYNEWLAALAPSATDPAVLSTPENRDAPS